SQRQVDELAHTVADEYFLGRHPFDAALLLLHDDGFAGGEYALLMHVAFAHAQILDHRETHGLGRTKSKGVGIADVERHDVVSQPLHVERTARELAADLVANVGKPRARLQALAHR